MPKPIATPQKCTPSPLPRPNIVDEPLTFSTKKSRSSTPFSRPPRPPAKTCPPISRVFKRRPSDHILSSSAQSVTFRTPDGAPTAKPLEYDRNKRESYFEQAFQIEEEIGDGYFGTVYRVKSKEDGKQYAVKIAKERYRGQADRKRKLEEVRKHEFLLPHPNCVHFFQSWEENGRVYQQFELCRTNLAELGERRGGPLPEEDVWAYLVDLLYAVRHLHDHNLVHMDIKPENIFLGDECVCKLGDFGLVIDVSKDPSGLQSQMGAVGGDSKYMAAEILEGKYTKAADVFSLGITILELATDLDLPNGGVLWHKLRNEGPDPTFFMSPDLRRVIKLMMGRDHERRPTVEQVLSMQTVRKAAARRKRQLRWIKMKSKILSLILPWLVFVAHLVNLVLVYPFQSFMSRFRNTSIYSCVAKWMDFDPKAYDVSMRTPPVSGRADESLPVYNRGPRASSFSSDDDDMDAHNSSNHSVLATPLSSTSSPIRSRERISSGRDDSPVSSRSRLEEDNEELALSPNPRKLVAARGGPRRLLDLQTQSMPNMNKSRKKAQANTRNLQPHVPSPKKRIDFDGIFNNGDSSEKQDPKAKADLDVPNMAWNEESSDEDGGTIKPVALATRFDYYSEDSD